MEIMKYRVLLEQARPFIDAKRKSAELRPPNFNIFEVLGCDKSELMHTKFLRHLLDPQATHGQGSLFLRHFLKLVQDEAHKQKKHLVPGPLNEVHADWICQEETRNIDGQTDLELHNKNYKIIVENKIYAADQPQQLQRYWRKLNETTNIPANNKVLIYLTPTGKEPDKQSLGDEQQRVEVEKHLVLLSYRAHLSNIFHKIANELLHEKTAISLAEILLQYSGLVARL